MMLHIFVKSSLFLIKPHEKQSVIGSVGMFVHRTVMQVLFPLSHEVNHSHFVDNIFKSIQATSKPCTVSFFSKPSLCRCISSIPQMLSKTLLLAFLKLKVNVTVPAVMVMETWSG